MIEKRLLNILDSSRKYIKHNIFFQWLSMLANIFIVLILVNILDDLAYGRTLASNRLILSFVSILGLIAFRALFRYKADQAGHKTNMGVKSDIRERIYRKLLRLGPNYKEKVSTAEVSQLASEGVEQLEVYFSKYVPQFYYSLIVPLTLFLVLSRYSFKISLILLLGVPLIPISIVLVMKIAKKLLDKYWNIYIGLGDSFLENLQGLTTLKIYEADEFKNQEMNKEAEDFRVVTMKVLSMQLNSIIVMDLVAYGGAAIGIGLSILEFAKGNLRYGQSMAIIMLSSEFFLPMRLLGSFFHISMNGVSASKKIFDLLDLEEEEDLDRELERLENIEIKDLFFSYDGEKLILNNINMNIKPNEMIAIVGESGSGKSTIAKLLQGLGRDYEGHIRLDGKEIKNLAPETIVDNISYIGHEDYIFKGSVRENLLMASENLTDEKLWQALEKVRLRDFLESEKGLDTELLEGGANLSGGQRQRLALARILLKDSPVLILDEATSNIDVESEEAIMDLIRDLKSRKTVIIISHRLANVVDSDRIYVLDQGSLVERGSHKELMEDSKVYRGIYKKQEELESYRGGINA